MDNDVAKMPLLLSPKTEKMLEKLCKENNRSIRTLEELREFLLNYLQRKSAGEITPIVANATASLVGKIISTHGKLDKEQSAIDKIEKS